MPFQSVLQALQVLQTNPAYIVSRAERSLAETWYQENEKLNHLSHSREMLTLKQSHLLKYLLSLYSFAMWQQTTTGSRECGQKINKILVRTLNLSKHVWESFYFILERMKRKPEIWYPDSSISIKMIHSVRADKPEQTKRCGAVRCSASAGSICSGVMVLSSLQLQHTESELWAEWLLQEEPAVCLCLLDTKAK